MRGVGGGEGDEQTTRLTNVCGIPTIPQECPGDAGKAATRSTVYSLEATKTRAKGKETPLNPTVDIIQGHLTIFRFSVTGWWLTGLAVGVGAGERAGEVKPKKNASKKGEKSDESAWKQLN